MPTDNAGRRDQQQDDQNDIPEYERDGKFTFEEAREEQAELEGLIRKYGGDFQKAVDAQRRGEKPDDNEPSTQNW